MRISHHRWLWRSWRQAVLLGIAIPLYLPDPASAQADNKAPARKDAEQPAARFDPPPDPWTDPKRARVLEALRRGLADSDAGVRLDAVKFFGQPGQDLNLLAAAVHDSDPQVWAEAVHWLCYHRKIQAEFAASLSAHLAQPDAKVRREAVRALADVIPAIGPETLLRLAKLIRDPDADIRRDAVHALKLYGPKAAEAALEALNGPPIDADDAKMLCQIAVAVWKIDPRHADPAAWLLNRPPDWASAAAIAQATVEIAGENVDIGPGLARAVASANALAKARALAAASIWGNRALIVSSRDADLGPAFSDPAAKDVPPPRTGVVKDLVAALVARLCNPGIDAEERANLIDALGHIGPAAAAAVPTLIKQLEKSADPLAKLTTASAVLGIDPDETRALQVLWEAAADADPDFSEMALSLLLDAIADKGEFIREEDRPRRTNLAARVSRALAADSARLRVVALQVAHFSGLPVPGGLTETLYGDVREQLKSVAAARLPTAIQVARTLESNLSADQRSDVVRILLQRLDNPDASARTALVRDLARQARLTLSEPVRSPFGNADPGEPREPAKLPPDVLGAIFDAIIGRIGDLEPSVRLATLKLLRSAEGLAGLGFEGADSPLFRVVMDRQTRYLDAVASRLDDTIEIRQCALDLLVSSSEIARVTPDLSERAWQATVKLMDGRTHSQEKRVRHGAIVALSRLGGGAWFLLSNAPRQEPPDLGDRGRQVIEILKRSLADPEPANRQTAAYAILGVELGRRPDLPLALMAWHAVESEDALGQMAFARELSRVASNTPEERTAWRLALTARVAFERPSDHWFGAPDLVLQQPFDNPPQVVFASIGEFMNGLTGPDRAVRLKSALALSRVSPLFDERQAASLLPSLADGDPEVRRLIFRAAQNWVFIPLSVQAESAPNRSPPSFIKPLWPPPPGYVTGLLPLDALARKSASWGETVRWLASVLSAADYTVCYYPIPPSDGSVGQAVGEDGEIASIAGFALVTRIEQVELDGTRRKQPGDRAERGLLWPRSWSEVWARLTGKPAGRYRMILFVLRPGARLPEFVAAPRPIGVADDEAVMSFGWFPVDVRSIAETLPGPMRSKPFGDGKVWVAVYDIERRQGSALKPYFSGDPDLVRNLRAAGLGALVGDGSKPPQAGSARSR
jgi:hypothetical protein